jgi:hypothetical protein
MSLPSTRLRRARPGPNQRPPACELPSAGNWREATGTKCLQIRRLVLALKLLISHRFPAVFAKDRLWRRRLGLQELPVKAVRFQLATNPSIAWATSSGRSIIAKWVGQFNFRTVNHECCLA